MDFGGKYSENFNNHNHCGHIFPNPLLIVLHWLIVANPHKRMWGLRRSILGKKKKMDWFAQDGGEEQIPDLFTTLFLGFFPPGLSSPEMNQIDDICLPSRFSNNM